MAGPPRLDDEPGLVDETWVSAVEAARSVPGLRSYVDRYDNRCDRLLIPSGETTVLYDALVDVPERLDAVAPGASIRPVDELPDDALVYLLPSRFCPVDELADDAWAAFGGPAPRVGPRGRRVRLGARPPPLRLRQQHAVDDRPRRLPQRDGASAATSPTWRSRSCRALNIPARYVFGYLPDIGVPPPDVPMDFCAWLEAYLDDRWYTFDPRNNERRTGRVVIGRGRDAVDVAMLTSYGPVELLTMTVWADVASPSDQPLGHGPVALAGSSPTGTWANLPGPDPPPVMDTE